MSHAIADAPFATIADCIRRHAAHAPRRLALTDATTTLDYAGLDARMDRVAAALQRDGLQPGDAIAVCSGTSVPNAVLFLGALRAGVVVAPLAPGAAPASLMRMVDDAQAVRLFVDAASAPAFVGHTRAPIERVGKTQRLAAMYLIDELPRSPIGKVLKRDLRERHAAQNKNDSRSDR